MEIYATSIDYNPKAEISIAFFKVVQNRIHYAIHGETAAEIIFQRADAEKDFMGVMFIRAATVFRLIPDFSARFEKEYAGSSASNLK